MVDLAATSDPALLELLRYHPKVAAVQDGPRILQFVQGDWVREVRVSDARVELRGIVELMDNNPLVCASVVSIPSPGMTLASIALGPLAAAGLIVEAPVILTNARLSQAETDHWLYDLGWQGGLTIERLEGDLKSALTLTAMVVVRTPEDPSDLDDLFDERYGRSFYVRRDDEGPWDVEKILGMPHALYRLRYTPDAPNSLLTVQVMSDAHGKAGVAQVIHTMNVMCGYEESLGLDSQERSPVL